MNKRIFYLNTSLFFVVIIFAVATFSSPGQRLVQKVAAAIGAVYCDTGITPCNVNYLARFVGAAPLDPSNTIGNSGIYQDAAGDIGIGTTDPRARLEIGSGYSTTPEIIGGLGIAAGGGSPDKAQIMWGDSTGWKLHFGSRTGASSTFLPRVTFVDSGNVGIGTTSPFRSLEIRGGLDTYIHFTNDDTGTLDSDGSLIGIGTTEQMTFMNREDTDTKFFTFGQERLRIKNDGKVGIGTPSPGALLHVNGAMMLTPLPTDPLSPVNGMMWMR